MCFLCCGEELLFGFFWGGRHERLDEEGWQLGRREERLLQSRGILGELVWAVEREESERDFGRASGSFL